MAHPTLNQKQGTIVNIIAIGLLALGMVAATLSQSDDDASGNINRGGASATGFSLDATPAPLPMQTGAQCTDGILLIERPQSPLLRRPSRIAEDFLIAPFNLFYEDLRLDAARRCE